MKRPAASAIGTMVALLLCTSLLFAGGCRKEKPKGFIEKVDEAITNIDTVVGELSKDLSELSNTLKAGTELTLTTAEQIYNMIKAKASHITSLARTAREDTRKIAGMEGVPEYRKYARIQEEVLDNAVAIANSLSDLFDQLSSATEALRTGKAPDTSRLAQTVEALSSELDRLKKQGEELKQKARKLKEEKRL